MGAEARGRGFDRSFCGVIPLGLQESLSASLI